MKLLFIINNIQEAYYEYENTGSMSQGYRKITRK